MIITCVTNTGGSIAFIAITCASSGYPNLFAKFFTSLQKSSYHLLRSQTLNFAIPCTTFEGFYPFNCHLAKNMDFMVLAFAASSGAASGSNIIGYSVKVDNHVLALPQQVSLNLLHFCSCNSESNLLLS